MACTGGLMTNSTARVTATALQLCTLLAVVTPHSAWAAERSDSPRVQAPKPKQEAKESPQYHRYAFIGAGVLAAGGLVFGFIAHGQQERAKTLSSAAEAAKTREDARQSAATANVLYALAGATLAYALVLELLPKPAAEKASLTFHF